MTTIRLETEEKIWKTHFKDSRTLYEYLHEHFLGKKLAEIEKEENSKPMTYEESVKYLDSL